MTEPSEVKASKRERFFYAIKWLAMAAACGFFVVGAHEARCGRLFDTLDDLCTGLALVVSVLWQRVIDEPK